VLVKRRLALVTASLALVGGLLPGALPTASAGPSAAGYSTDNVTHLKTIPFEVGTATGARTFKVKGNEYLMVTSWKSFSIYDLKDPLNPTLVGTPVPFGFKFENEDVATNGRIMLFSEELPENVLHVWDIQNVEAPREIAALPDGGGHTSSCIFDCKYSLSSEGPLVDLRRPDQPVLLANWLDILADAGTELKQVHDVTEVAPGIVLTASKPSVLLDFRKSVTAPKVLATYENISGKVQHSVQWPRGGKDKFAFMSEESNASGTCPENGPKFISVDTTGWQKSKKLKVADTYGLQNGAFVDGGPPVNGLGCSTHWFQQHPTFHNGGLIALGSYEHGTRFLTVSPKGALEEVGWFVPFGGSTSAAYWITPTIVYNVDYTRGLDILQYDGPLK
jgi:hypothetical protein